MNECFHKKMEANNATMIEYIIRLATAKEMADLVLLEKEMEGIQGKLKEILYR